MTVFRAATLRTLFFAFHVGAKELRLCGSLCRREFWFCARWEELRIYVNKTLQESFNRFLFFV